MRKSKLGDVRLSMNGALSPGQQAIIARLKKRAAKLINEIDEIPDTNLVDSSEFQRAKSLAVTQIEIGCMWAVKAAAHWSKNQK